MECTIKKFGENVTDEFSREFQNILNWRNYQVLDNNFELTRTQKKCFYQMNIDESSTEEFYKLTILIKLLEYISCLLPQKNNLLISNDRDKLY